MKTEYEVRKLEVEFDDVIRKLEKLGAKRVGVYHQKRYVYDFNPAQKGRWIRLRSNGEVTTLTIKEIKSLRMDGTKELEIEVSDFEDANEVLNKLGYVSRTYQENFRIEYRLENVNFDLDKWPMIPSYLEIEGQTEEDVREALNSLNMDESDVTTMDIDTLYNRKYGICLDEIKNLRFSEVEYKMLEKYND